MNFNHLGRSLAGRFGGMLAVLSLVSVLVFILTRLAAGDPIALLLGDQASLQDIELTRQRYGLDQPLLAQFLPNLVLRSSNWSVLACACSTDCLAFSFSWNCSLNW